MRRGLHLALQAELHLGHLLSQPLDLFLLAVGLGHELDLVLGLAARHGQPVEEAVRVGHHVDRGPLDADDARAQVVLAEDLVVGVDRADDEYLPRNRGRVLSDQLGSAAERELDGLLVGLDAAHEEVEHLSEVLLVGRLGADPECSDVGRAQAPVAAIDDALHELAGDDCVSVRRHDHLVAQHGRVEGLLVRHHGLGLFD